MPSRARAETEAHARSELIDLLRKHRVPNTEGTLDSWLAAYRREHDRTNGVRELAAAQKRRRDAVQQTLAAVRTLQGALNELEAAGMWWAPLYSKPCAFDLAPQALLLELKSRPWAGQEALEEAVNEMWPAVSDEEAETLSTLGDRNRLDVIRDELAHLEVCMVARLKQPKFTVRMDKRPVIALAGAVARTLHQAGVPLRKTRDSVFGRCLMLASTIAGDRSSRGDQLYLIRLAAEGIERDRRLRLVNLSRAQGQ